MHKNHHRECATPKALEELEAVEGFKYIYTQMASVCQAFANKEELLGDIFGNYKPFGDLLTYL